MITARERWVQIKDLSCPDCGGQMLHVGLLPRAPFRPMQDIFHCDECGQAKLRDAHEKTAD